MSGDLFRRVRPGNVWIFVTERCNLRCDYCFFACRAGSRPLALPRYDALLRALPGERPQDIVFSGGEPLLCWDRTRRMVLMARRRHPGAALTVQTNALLLDRGKVAFLKDHDVVVEPGIDGDLATNRSHRRGVDAAGYRRLTDNIRLLVGAGAKVSPTMTVHPGAAERMEANFLGLLRLGLSDIEVHPAFLAPWTPASAAAFARGYRAILQREKDARRPLLCRDYSMPGAMAMDLVVLPDGRVLPNWTYLSFPAEVRDRFVTLNLSESGPRPVSGVLTRYLGELRAFFAAGPRTYRDVSNMNAARALAVDRRPDVRRWFHVYVRLCARVQAMDQQGAGAYVR